MPRRPSRRDEICRAAVTLAARGGSHALTHQAVDAELGISRGSTSYYYRSRRALIEAVATHLAEESRAHFDALVSSGDVTTWEEADLLIDGYVDGLVRDRRQACRARYALLLDADCDGHLRETLAGCLFSRVAAVGLFTSLGRSDPQAEADRLLDQLEGEVVRRVLLDHST